MSIRSYRGIVARNDPARNEKPFVYEFNSRNFKNADSERRGLYANAILSPILLETQTDPADMPRARLSNEDGSFLGQES